jgi:hypothetical protein
MKNRTQAAKWGQCAVCLRKLSRAGLFLCPKCWLLTTPITQKKVVELYRGKYDVAGSIRPSEYDVFIQEAIAEAKTGRGESPLVAGEEVTDFVLDGKGNPIRATGPGAIRIRVIESGQIGTVLNLLSNNLALVRLDPDYSVERMLVTDLEVLDAH